MTAHQDLHYLPNCFMFKTETPINISGHVQIQALHVQIQGWNNSLLKVVAVMVLKP